MGELTYNRNLLCINSLFLLENTNLQLYGKMVKRKQLLYKYLEEKALH